MHISAVVVFLCLYGLASGKQVPEPGPVEQLHADFAELLQDLEEESTGLHQRRGSHVVHADPHYGEPKEYTPIYTEVPKKWDVFGEGKHEYTVAKSELTQHRGYSEAGQDHVSLEQAADAAIAIYNLEGEYTKEGQNEKTILWDKDSPGKYRGDASVEGMVIMYAEPHVPFESRQYPPDASRTPSYGVEALLYATEIDVHRDGGGAKRFILAFRGSTGNPVWPTNIHNEDWHDTDAAISTKTFLDTARASRDVAFIDNMVDKLELNQLNTKSITVVGHSLGGCSAARAAKYIQTHWGLRAYSVGFDAAAFFDNAKNQVPMTVMIRDQYDPVSSNKLIWDAKADLLYHLTGDHWYSGARNTHSAVFLTNTEMTAQEKRKKRVSTA